MYPRVTWIKLDHLQSYLDKWSCRPEDVTPPRSSSSCLQGTLHFLETTQELRVCLQSWFFPFPPNSPWFSFIPALLQLSAPLPELLQLQEWEFCAAAEAGRDLICSGAAGMPNVHSRASRRKQSPPQTSFIFLIPIFNFSL